MLELQIREKVYQFNFGMGFMHEINKKINQPVDGLKDVSRNIGLRYYVSGLIDNDVEDLVEVLFAANKGFTPRVTKELLDEFIDNISDIDSFFEEVLDYLKQANATKKITMLLLAEVERMKAEQAQAKN